MGPTGRYAAVEEVDAETDEVAIAIARRLTALCLRRAAFELWDPARKVHAEPLESC
jgi:hypothetical protein